MQTIPSNRRRQAEETYLTWKPLLCKLVFRHQKKWGGDSEELMGEAHIYFCRAYASWLKGKDSKFGSYLWTVVSRGLIEYERVNRAKRRTPETGLVNGWDWEDSDVQDRALDLNALFVEASKDARSLLEMALCPPVNIRVMAPTRFRHPSGRRKTMWKYLLRMGWTVHRIAEAFEEVREGIEAK